MTDLISTKQAMQLLGVGSTTIKRWAAAGKLPYTRTVGGHRRFDRAAVDALRASNGASAGRTAKVSNWIRMLLADDRHDVRQEIIDLRSDYEDWFEVADFLGAVLMEIGRGWANLELSVIEEHIASNKLYNSVLLAADDFPEKPAADVCLLATPSRERHTGGLILAAFCMRSAGIDAQWVGAEVPVTDLVLHIRKSVDTPQWLALSASEWSTDTLALDSFCRRLGAECDRRGIGLLLGGNGAWPDTPGHARRITSFKQLKPILGSP